MRQPTELCTGRHCLLKLQSCIPLVMITMEVTDGLALFLPSPTCGHGIEKISGCNHVL